MGKHLLMTGGILLVLLGMAVNGDSVIGRTVRELLFSGDWVMTGNAMKTLLRELREGVPAMDALTVFCRQILKDGGYGLY